MSLFSDDFSGDLSKWFDVPTGWSIVDGKLVSNSDGTISANVILSESFKATFKIKAIDIGYRYFTFLDADGNYNDFYMDLNAEDGGIWTAMFFWNESDDWLWNPFDGALNEDLYVTIIKNGSTWDAYIGVNEDYTLNNHIDHKESWLDNPIIQIGLMNSGDIGTEWQDIEIVEITEPESSSLKCITNIITIHEISSLKCISNIRDDSNQYSTLKCISNIPFGLFHTGFALPELPSEISINNINLGSYFGLMLYGTQLDTINKRLNVCYTKYANYSNSGNFKISGIDLLNGYVCQFSLGGDVQNLTLLFNFDIQDFGGRFWQGYYIILNGTTNTVEFYQMNYSAGQTLIDSIPYTEDFTGFYSLIVENGKVSLNKDGTFLFEDMVIGEINKNDIYFISTLTPVNPEDTPVTWIDNIDIRLPPPNSSLKCKANVVPTGAYFFDGFNTEESLSDNWDQVGSGYSIVDNKLVQSQTAGYIISKPFFTIPSDFVFEIVLNVNDGLELIQGECLEFRVDGNLGHGDKTGFHIIINPVTNTFTIQSVNSSEGIIKTVPIDVTIDNKLEIWRINRIWQFKLNGTIIIKTSIGFYDAPISLFDMFPIQGTENSVTLIDYIKFIQLPRISTLNCITHIVDSRLPCKTNIHTTQLLRTSFDGAVLNEHITSAMPLDTVNHRLPMGGATFNGLDLISKGFDLEFELDLDELPNHLELDSITIRFNPIPSEWESLASNHTDLVFNKDLGIITLIRYTATISGFNVIEAPTNYLNIPYNGTSEGVYKLGVTSEGIVNFWLNGEHLIRYFYMEFALQADGLSIAVNNPGTHATSWMDNLVITYATQTSKLSCKSHIKDTRVISSLKCKTNIGKLFTLNLTLQGSIFDDNPVQPPIQPPVFPIDPNNPQPIPEQLKDKVIFLSVNEMVFPDMIDFSIETRGNDSNTTYTIEYQTPDDLLLFTGQVVTLIELGGNPDGFFQGVIQKLVEKKTNERTYTLTGRNIGNNMVTQGFHIDAVVNNPTAFTSEEWVNMIIFGSDVRLGACVDYHVDEIFNANHLYNGFAGNWDTKAAALTELMSLISKLRNQNISWFLDNQGLLRIFYTDQLSEDVAIDIALNDPRVENYEFSEDAQNILNDQRGKGGQNNEFKAELQDIESKNGWVDSNNSLTWPGYGFQPGTIIQDSSVTGQGQLNEQCQHLINMDSKPIFTLQLVLSKFPGCEIGQPLVINDHYKLKGHVTVITSIVLTGNTAERFTTLTTTNDKKILGPLNEFESVAASVKHTIHETMPFYGIVVDLGDGHANIKPVNNIATINAKDLSKQE